MDDEPEGSIKVFNTHVLIETDGSLLARYRKVPPASAVANRAQV